MAGEISRKELILALIPAGTNPRLAGVNLSVLDLTRLDLSGANMRGCNLQAATLREAILRGVESVLRHDDHDQRGRA